MERAHAPPTPESSNASAAWAAELAHLDPVATQARIDFLTRERGLQAQLPQSLAEVPVEVIRGLLVGQFSRGLQAALDVLREDGVCSPGVVRRFIAAIAARNAEALAASQPDQPTEEFPEEVAA